MDATSASASLCVTKEYCLTMFLVDHENACDFHHHGIATDCARQCSRCHPHLVQADHRCFTLHKLFRTCIRIPVNRQICPCCLSTHSKPWWGSHNLSFHKPHTSSNDDSVCICSEHVVRLTASSRRLQCHIRQGSVHQPRGVLRRFRCLLHCRCEGFESNNWEIT